ncbi:HAD family hydrolase [Vibrio cyclitrophicus]|uniref:HAD family hydrolase n=1 Tax=Vibrio cyclitrophicus TaxID=47951 RepID=UPI000C849C43|nr:HAD hydrolase-like protein [Vibrio cyclitrophicus]PMJ53048.1 haloacid dehalogenase [Vibrio cyclitrophicus]
MHLLSSYQVYIFDCDGVILDSNELKINAMKNSLKANFSESESIEQCVEYFRNNFGKSRFHHVSYFLEEILKVNREEREVFEKSILKNFSDQCRTLYLSAEITPGFLEYLKQCNGKKYIASGSEQNELRDVFAKRGLDKYFDGIFGSPAAKVENVRHILELEQTNNAVMYGDALSDLYAAKDNNCHFVAYLPFSNVRKKLIEETKKADFFQAESWGELKC